MHTRADTPRLGLGYRRDMYEWDMRQLQADFFEVVPENWLRRDRAPLHQLRASGRPVWLHGVSLNLGGYTPLRHDFLRDLRTLIAELGGVPYSDHLAASGDAHQLYDLFPVPFTPTEARRIADRICAVQDVLGQRIAIENPTWYSNVGTLPEPEFLARVAELADCQILLDLNNLEVNHKNHGLLSARAFVAQVDMARVSYLHVAGHEFDTRFDLHVDTHSQPVSADVRALAAELAGRYHLPILLEWDNDIPDPLTLNQELQCLHTLLATTPVPSMPMCAA